MAEWLALPRDFEEPGSNLCTKTGFPVIQELSCDVIFNDLWSGLMTASLNKLKSSLWAAYIVEGCCFVAVELNAKRRSTIL